MIFAIEDKFELWIKFIRKYTNLGYGDFLKTRSVTVQVGMCQGWSDVLIGNRDLFTESTIRAVYCSEPRD